jgi:hypothetical protein
MTLEMITGLVVAVFAAIAAAFGLGHSRGTSKAEAKADQQRTEDNSGTGAAAERRVEATKEASNVQQTVNHMPDDDVDRELRDTGPVPVVVVDTACDWVKPIYLTDHDWTLWTARRRKTSWRITKRGRRTARNKPEPRNSGAFNY